MDHCVVDRAATPTLSLLARQSHLETDAPQSERQQAILRCFRIVLRHAIIIHRKKK